MNNLYRSLSKWWSTRTCLFLQTFPYAETYHNVASTYIACGHVRHGFCLPVIDLTPLPVSKNIALSLVMVRLLYNYNLFFYPLPLQVLIFLARHATFLCASQILIY